jgi:tetratricopeptide (TPR) repeat protein
MNDFSHALEHYLAVLRFRPRYSYGAETDGFVTPPEIEGYGWPQVYDRKTSKSYNIRSMPLTPNEGHLMAFFYARLGRCLFSCRQDRESADHAFNISLWLLEKLGSRAERKMEVTVRSERGRFLLETGNSAVAAAEFENAVSLWSQMLSEEAGLASALIDLGEAYVRSGDVESARKHLKLAIDISRRLNRQDLTGRAEKLLRQA